MMQTCRICGDLCPGFNQGPMLTYGHRHHAHWYCYVNKWGEKIFEKLKRRDLEKCPLKAIKDNNLMEKFDEYFGKT